MNKQQIVVGIDIGGSHITVAPVDLTSGKIITEGTFRGEVNSKGSVEEVIQNWGTVITSCINFCGATKLGIAMPGPFDYEKGIALIKDNNKYEALYGLNVKELLAESLNLSTTDVLMKNDAGCFLQGEAVSGAARKYSRGIGMTLGTGIGTAFMENSLADDASMWCSPFKDGVAEDYISTLWFEQQYVLRTGNKKSVKDMALTHDQDEVARALFLEFAQNFGEFIVGFAQQRKPEVIVVGGNIMKSSQLFMPRVFEILGDNDISIPVKCAELGEEAAIIGAASLHR
ncbi:ROK family protein [Marinoscillum pacificum]|uniref:ROK family protein n=1 Tax=Marinoscillum pacificum TaxID=392723 RepID=UPI0021571FCE|nr:ROK family protein [Marinoscillum pacificum]